MSSAYIIEIGESAVGLVTRDSASGAFHFFASDSRLHALEGQPSTSCGRSSSASGN